MIVDTSVLVAILNKEPDAAVYVEAMADASVLLLSAASYLELGIVIDRDKDPEASAEVDAFLSSVGIEIIPVTETQARLAREAHQQFGRGSGHPAKLNFGDCFSYALARDTGQPLLFKGNDFAVTDGIRLAEPAA